MDSRSNDDPIDPGWYEDPAGSGGMRYWDGSRWTAHTSTPAGDRSSRSQQSPHRVGLIAAALVMVVALGAIGVSLLVIGQPATAVPSEAAAPALDGSVEHDVDAEPRSMDPAGDIQVEQREGAIYLYYSSWVEPGESNEDMLGTQLDGASRVSEALSNADAYCVGDDLLIVVVRNDTVDLSEVQQRIGDMLRDDFEPSIFTTDIADFERDSWVALVQCHARDGQIIRQGGGGTFP